jgi:L-alanine-DL-glutamate epimerase-like enolase superfamily enzyme
LDAITRSGLDIRDGQAYPSNAPGLGIDWDWNAIADRQVAEHWSIVS